MAAKAEWSCPICRDARNDVAYAMPCRHQFCLGCILRWTEIKPECPLCRRQIEVVRFCVVGEDDYLQCVITPPEESPDASSQAGRAPSHPAENSPHGPVASPPSSPQGMVSPAEQGAAGPQATVGGLLPSVWAELFQRNEHFTYPVQHWLHEELEEIYGNRWWMARSAESTILHALCTHGPDEEAMVQVLQDYLEEYTVPLVRGVINVITCECSEDARWLVRSCAEGEDNSPAASSSSSSSSSSCSWGENLDSILAATTSPAGSDGVDQPGTSEAALGGGPGRPPSAMVAAEEEDSGEAAVAGPCAQGCSPSPSAPGRGRDRSPEGPRRAPKRRAPGPQDSPRPCKRPPRRRH
ncbi:TOPRS ligase, partial [Oceanites oceanicus]|nr:TOPRS ligase [Oceanites oceanicus]